MTKMTSLSEMEAKPEPRKRQSKSKIIWIVGIVVIALCAVFIIALTNTHSALQNKKEELITKQNQWNQAEKNLTEANNQLSEENLALTTKNNNLESLAEKRLKQRDRALTDAVKEKAYGKEMEKLALSHAKKVSTFRVENDKLSRELQEKKAEAEGYKANNENLEERLMMYKNMVEKMKNEIARISENCQKLLNAQRKK